MSVELDLTHQGCCCEPFNLEQLCCATTLASLPALMHSNIESEASYYNIVLSLPACAANFMPCNAPRVLCSREL